VPILLLLTLALFAAPLAHSGTPAAGDTLVVTVMSTTDLHGHVIPWDYYTDEPEPRFALSKVATLVDSVRASGAHTLLLDAGDWLQGNPLAEQFATADTLARYPLLAAVDAMRYDAVVLGNHEFNFGIDLLNRRIAQTETPILGANIYGHGTTEPAYVPYIIRDVAGVRVGIVGLTTPGSAVWDRPRVEGRLDFGDGVEAAERFVAEVRQRGAEVVIVLAHTGLEGGSSYTEAGLGQENFGRAIAEQVPGVDLLVLGHTHRVTEEVIKDSEGREVGVIQAGRWASHLGLAEMSIVRGDDGMARVVETSLRAVPVNREDVKSHPEVEALAAEGHARTRAHMSHGLATTTTGWRTETARVEPTAAIDLIHHVQRAATGAQLSAAAAFNTRVVLGPDSITAGQITQLYPYENALYVIEISGRDLRRFLEHAAQYYLPPTEPGGAPTVNPQWPGYNFDMVAGVSYTLDLTAPAGQRVTELTYEGRPVQDDQTFTMATNSYRAEGGGGFPGMRAANVVLRMDGTVRQMIIDYLRQRGSISPEDVQEADFRLRPRPAGDFGAR
jgi:2',3'-cyclic-nucleotide 2'-phosphodiesterase (5'-nucleotidase family)